MQNDYLKELKSKIQKDSPIPLYYQIEKELERIIISGVLPSGFRLPGDLELSKFLGLNNRTVNKALQGLKQKGLIIRKQKAGTFIKDGTERNSPTVGFFYFREAEERMRKISEYIYQFLHPLGFDLKIIPFEEDFYEKVNLYQKIKQMNLSGAVIVPLDTSYCKKALEILEKNKFPYVRLGNACFTGQLNAALVRGDDTQVAYSALRQLWKSGHRRIGLISTYEGNEAESAYRSFYAERGGFLPRRMVSVEFSGQIEDWKKLPGDQIIRGYLEMNPDITGLIVEPAVACVNILEQLSIMGKNVPQNISIISLREWEGLKILTPPISSFELPNSNMANDAVDKLIQAMKNGLPDKEEIIKEKFVFIERQSVAPLTGKKPAVVGI